MVINRKITVAVLSLIALLGLSACTQQPADKVAWENVHGGFLIENIYTGEDHI